MVLRFTHFFQIKFVKLTYYYKIINIIFQHRTHKNNKEILANVKLMVRQLIKRFFEKYFQYFINRL